MKKVNNFSVRFVLCSFVQITDYLKFMPKPNVCINLPKTKKNLLPVHLTNFHERVLLSIYLFTLADGSYTECVHMDVTKQWNSVPKRDEV